MIPAFQENDIERLAGHRSLHQGWDYYRSGAVAQAYRQGSVLKASCIGSARTLTSAGNVQRAGDRRRLLHVSHRREGRCKHVAALLICWRESPQAFAEIEPWDAVLARASRRELIEAIRSLVQRNPELEDAIETLLPRQETPAEAPSPETYRGRVADLIARSNDTPESAAYLAGQLLAIKEAGDQLAKSHDPAAAAAVYQAIIGELLEHPSGSTIITPSWSTWSRNVSSRWASAWRNCATILSRGWNSPHAAGSVSFRRGAGGIALGATCRA